MTQALSLDPKSTALILIDLQQSTVPRALAPYSGPQVVEQSVRLAEATRAAGGTVVYVRVLLAELLRLPTDASLRAPNAPPPPANASELVPEAGVQPGDLMVTKRQWGAFYGTDLDQQLRRRGIRTVVMGGIATNFGVESTARAAFDRGYGCERAPLRRGRRVQVHGPRAFDGAVRRGGRAEGGLSGGHPIILHVTAAEGVAVFRSGFTWHYGAAACTASRYSANSSEITFSARSTSVSVNSGKWARFRFDNSP